MSSIAETFMRSVRLLDHVAVGTHIKCGRAPCNYRQGRPLRTAAVLGDERMARLLIEGGADPNYADGGVLRQLIQLGDCEAVERLLRWGAIPSASAALRMSITRQRRDILEILLSVGADPRYDNGRALDDAVHVCQFSTSYLERILESLREPLSGHELAQLRETAELTPEASHAALNILNAYETGLALLKAPQDEAMLDAGLQL